MIVVVDDEESVRRALKRLMVSAGFRVESFATGADFLESLREGHPACVLVDLHMPGMSGFELQMHLKEQAIDVPVIIITGHDVVESEERAMLLGASAYLRKPVEDEVLLQALAEALSKTPNGT